MAAAIRMPALALAGFLLSGVAALAGPKIVSGPGPDAACFKPWSAQTKYMMATAVGGPLAIPVGIGVGLLVGLVNGLGVAYLRVPSMIFTLGVNAVMASR